MIDKLNYINIGGVDYPAQLTLNVLETIQDEFGSIEKWQDEINGDKNIKTLIWTFKELVNEGIDIENDKTSESRKFINHKQAGRLITELGLAKTSEFITSVVISSNITGNEDDDEKNLTAAQKK